MSCHLTSEAIGEASIIAQGHPTIRPTSTDSGTSLHFYADSLELRCITEMLEGGLNLPPSMRRKDAGLSKI